MVSKKEYIEKTAYFIWLNRGCPGGQDRDNWDEACRIYELTHIEAPIALSAPKAKPAAPIKAKVGKASRKASAKAKAGKASFGRIDAAKKPATKDAKPVSTKPAVQTKSKKANHRKAVAPAAKKAALSKPARKASRIKPALKAKAKMPAAKAVKEANAPAQLRPSAKIIPMPKDTVKPAAALPKTKIKIIVGAKR